MVEYITKMLNHKNFINLQLHAMPGRTVNTTLSYDLSTSSKWANLAVGNHNITIVAKADEYRDSNASNAVVVTKEAPVATVEAGTYIFEENPDFIAPLDVNATISATINTLTADDVYGSSKIIDNIAAYRSSMAELGTLAIYNDNLGYAVTFSDDWKYTDEDGNEFTATDNQKLRTIIIGSSQTVSNDFYEWFTTNTTKLS